MERPASLAIRRFFDFLAPRDPVRGGRDGSRGVSDCRRRLYSLANLFERMFVVRAHLCERRNRTHVTSREHRRMSDSAMRTSPFAASGFGRVA